MLLQLFTIASLFAPSADSLRADQEIRESVLRNSADVRRCYEREGLRRDATLRGTMEVELTILPTGSVDSVAVLRADLSSAAGRAEVTACVTSAARHWRFERGPYAVERVVFPFVLRPVTPASPPPGASTT
jgi:hypothetical protein